MYYHRAKINYTMLSRLLKQLNTTVTLICALIDTINPMLKLLLCNFFFCSVYV